MASIHREIPIAAPAAAVWDAIRDFGAVHQRLARGFVIDCARDGDVRTVTFANGNIVRERLVDCDDARRRLVYAAISERVSQHSAAMQVIDDGDHCRIVWITDVLPQEIAPFIEQQMTLGATAMQATLAAT